jgi:hypothetical protein
VPDVTQTVVRACNIIDQQHVAKYYCIKALRAIQLLVLAVCCDVNMNLSDLVVPWFSEVSSCMHGTSLMLLRFNLIAAQTVCDI